MTEIELADSQKTTGVGQSVGGNNLMLLRRTE